MGSTVILMKKNGKAERTSYPKSVELAEQIIGYLSYKIKFSGRNLGEIADIPLRFTARNSAMTAVVN